MLELETKSRLILVTPKVFTMVQAELFKLKKHRKKQCLETAIGRAMKKLAEQEGHKPKPIKTQKVIIPANVANLNTTRIKQYFSKHDGPISRTKLGEKLNISAKVVKSAIEKLILEKHVYQVSLFSGVYYAAYPELLSDLRKQTKLLRDKQYA